MRKTLAFVIHDQFSLFGYGVAHDLIRMASDSMDIPVFDTVTAAKSREPVKSSSGTSVLPDVDWSELRDVDYIFVCSFRRSDDAILNPTLAACIRENRRHGAQIVGFGTGVWTLAQAGVLSGRKAVADPKEASALRESFPDTDFAVAPFFIDGDIATCIGGDSVTDLILEILADRFGSLLAENVRRFVFLKPTRSTKLMQSLGLYDPTSALDPRLTRLLEVFDQTISKPMPLTAICNQIGVSLRSLSRLTHLYFLCSPGALYMRVRLNHAEMLLHQTSQNITQISLSCGFTHSSHFSTTFTKWKSVNPSEFRKSAKHCR